jgi:hypothetical protein
MPDNLTSYISIPTPIIIKERCAAREKVSDKTGEIEAFEADNFELRNQITRLKIHNATLRRMLKLPEGRMLGALKAPPQ